VLHRIPHVSPFLAFIPSFPESTSAAKLFPAARLSGVLHTRLASNVNANLNWFLKGTTTLLYVNLPLFQQFLLFWASPKSRGAQPIDMLTEP
jgi:hypothetical protein